MDRFGRGVMPGIVARTGDLQARAAGRGAGAAGRVRRD